MVNRIPIAYIECDIPQGLTVADWRRSKVRSRPPRRFVPSLRAARARRTR
jgi:hypothetical protein